MKNKIKICLVGAGSSYTPEIIKGAIENIDEGLPVDAINFFDLNTERMKIMEELSKRMLKAAKKNIKIRSFSTLDDALSGVDFVITQIRVGGMEARIKDEKIPLKYGLIGQETTGVGGMFKALRTIPYMLKIADAVVKSAPDAVILNYTNPSGIITEAISKYSSAKIIGLCAGIPKMQDNLKKDLEKDFPNFNSRCVGLNHLGFIHQFFSGSKDVTGKVIEKYLRHEQSVPDGLILPVDSLIKVLQAIPISYLDYYYRRNYKVEKLSAEAETRGEVVLKIQNNILAEAALPGSSEYPATLAKRGGGGYAKVTFDCMKAIWNNSGAQIACSVPNRGCVNGIDNDAVVEIMCSIDRKGATPLSVGNIPPAFRGLIQAVKTYETLTVEAAVKKELNLVYQALLNHPLVGDFNVIVPLVEEMMKAHRLKYR